jgi:tripeptide aminopeptidase
MKDFNIKLLKKVLSIQSHYAEDSDMIDYIKKALGSMKLEYTEDSFGNIYVTKGKPENNYPCIVSHIDTVVTKVNNFKVVQVDDVLIGFDHDKVQQHGIGGDDKVGVFMCLQTLKDVDNIKAVFFREEESGCKGSNHSIANNKDFYSDCAYIIQCDRYGNQDFITEATGIKISSEAFIKACNPLIKKHQYKTASGLSTDVATLSKHGVGISCVNLSCGYYNHHTSKEFVSIIDAEDCYNLVLDLINTLGETQYSHIYKEPVYKKTTYATKTYYTKPSDFKMVKETILDKYDIVVEPNPEFSYFKRFGTALLGKFQLSRKEPIPIKRKADCCGSEDTLFIRPKTNNIFCIECGKDVNRDLERKIYTDIIVSSDGTDFVYSHVEGNWLEKSKAVLVKAYNSYLRK